jgi:flavin reductase (DIM6/NTAB) family NADH-FMN oxidoreductase RutF
VPEVQGAGFRRDGTGRGLENLFAVTMAGHPSGVAVVTAPSATGVMGFAATAITSYSSDPPSILLSVSRTSRTHDYVVAAGEFGVHLLAHGQEDVATIFASKSDSKFECVPWEWDHGVPRIRGARAFLRCAPVAKMAYADHTIVIGSILDISFDDGLDPLVYYRRAFTWSIYPDGKHRTS